MNQLKHILLVEDNPGDVELIKIILSRGNEKKFKLHSKTDLHSALAFLSENKKIDIVLMDLGLPDSSGLDGLKKIKNRFPDLPVVVITGNNDEKMGEAALDMGAQDYIVKGLIPEQYLVQVIKYAIQRQDADVQIRQSEGKYRGIVDNIGIGVVLIDDEKTIIETNEKLRQWFPQVKPGQKLKCFETIQCMCEGDPDFNRCPVGQTLQDGLSHKSISRKGQTTFRLVSSALKNSSGTIKGVVLLQEDISERINMEAKLRQAQKMESLGTLAGGVAHDFNNILTAIQGFATLARYEAGENAELINDLSEIQKASNRATALVRQILTFSRMAEYEKKPILIFPLISEVLKLLRSTLPSNIEIINAVEKEPGYIVADPTQIHQVVMNLCTNAAHAMEMKGGTLTVSLKSESIHDEQRQLFHDIKAGDYLKLSIQDTGCGIPEDMLDSIFDPYFTTKGLGEGTGLGLSVVQGIVKDCGGEILVESIPDTGSTFHLYFPMAQKPALSRQRNNEGAISGGEGHILLVDDEVPILKIISRILGRLGYDIHTESDGQKALQYLQEGKETVDLIISDMNMPVMTGLEFARKAKENFNHIPFIIMTGYSRLISPERCSSYGIHSVLTKPIDVPEMAATVKNALHSPKKNQ